MIYIERGLTKSSAASSRASTAACAGTASALEVVQSRDTMILLHKKSPKIVALECLGNYIVGRAYPTTYGCANNCSLCLSVSIKAYPTDARLRDVV